MGMADVTSPSGTSPTSTGSSPKRQAGIPLRRIPVAPLGQVSALDGIRAIALLGVLFYHARFTWLPGGFLGVSAFFTLSGFLITSLLLREWVSAGTLDCRRFWSRRGRRLLPAAWVTIALVIAMGAAGVWDTEQLRDLRSDVPYSLVSLLNWHFIRADRSYGARFAAPSPLEHFWSLAVEQQFYLILPILVMGVLLVIGKGPQRKRLQLLIGVLATLTLLSALANGLLARGAIDRSYFGTETRAAEILIGALLACFTLRGFRVRSVKLQRLLLVLALAAVCVTGWLWHVARLRSEWLYPWGFLLTATCTAVIIFAGLQRSVLSRALSIAPLLWLGRISYGVYLLHWPIFLWLTPARTGLSQWPLFGLRLAVTLPCAVLMFRILENPVRLGVRLKGISALKAGSVVVVAILVGTFLITRNLEPKSSLQMASANSSSTSTTVPPPLPLRTLSIGDGSIQSITATAGESEGLQNSAHGVADCGLALGGWVSLSDGRVERDVERCAGVRQGWTTAVQTEQPEYTLVTGTTRDLSPRRLSSQSAWEQSDSPQIEDFLRTDIADLVDQLASTSTKVVLLTLPHMRRTLTPSVLPEVAPVADPTAEAMRQAERVGIRQGAPTPEFYENDDARVDRYNALLGQVATSRGLQLLDLASYMRSLEGGEFDPSLRPDGVGVSLKAAVQIRVWIESQLRVTATVPAVATSLAAQQPVSGVLNLENPLPAAPEVSTRRRVLPESATRVLVVGDSVAHSYGYGLERWADSMQQIQVFNAAQFGCPIARGGAFRFQQDIDFFSAECDWAQQIPGWLNRFQPDIVLLSSSIWEVVDRRFLGDDRFRHVGDPAVDHYLLSEFLSAIDLLGSTGASVQVVSQAHFNAGLDQGFSGLPESDPARTDRLNQILLEAVSLRPGVASVLDLASWLAAQPGGDINVEVRPDGLHFTDEYSRIIADWLGPESLRVAGQQ
jgi:peptidoglycan/LPS O-acetylase OafA/YrhL